MSMTLIFEISIACAQKDINSRGTFLACSQSKLICLGRHFQLGMYNYEFPKDKYQQFVEVYFSREIKKGNLISRENLLKDAQVNIYSRCSS